MYPLTYYETFMRYEASYDVFVAMPFTKSIEKAYVSVIEPAIKAVTINGKPLNPRIINRGTTGSPDIHEQIFDAIIHSRFVIADLTIQSKYRGDDHTTRWQANANVAYEVGLASAWRNPEDILLIYQEHPKHSYSFDVQNLRHIAYRVSDRQAVILDPLLERHERRLPEWLPFEVVRNGVTAELLHRLDGRMNVFNRRIHGDQVYQYSKFSFSGALPHQPAHPIGNSLGHARPEDVVMDVEHQADVPFLRI
jgi:hypothetical protein